MLLWFTTPVPLTGWEQLLLLLPLCLAVSVVYKTTKLDNIRDLPKACLASWATILAGMFGVGAALYLLHWLVA